MQNYFRKSTLLTLILLVLANFSLAQNSKFPASPREEVLLNDLKVLIWTKPNTKRVSVKLRIHSGAAFDPQDKAGTTAMLSEILFPEEAIKTYFEEDLEGKLEIITTHDYVQINASAKSGEFITVMETLSSAVTGPQIDKETFAKIKPLHLEKLIEFENDPKYIADQAVAERLYGNYPYGRPVNGTAESINKLDFADLIFSKQRFLTADNATLLISGDVDSNYAYKAARRLFGSWQKSLKKVPANFRIPESPDTTPLTINIDEGKTTEYRMAVDTIARDDKNFFAYKVLTNAWQEKYCDSTKFVFNPYFLRGTLLVKKSVVTSKDLPVGSNKCELFGLSTEPNGKIELGYITKEQFGRSKESLSSEFSKSLLNENEPSDLWLDVDTYQLKSVKDELKKLEKTDFNDSKEAFDKLAKSFREKNYANISVVPTQPEPKMEIKQSEDPKDPLK